MDWTQILSISLAGGSCLYLIIEKLFSRSQDNAKAHSAKVVSFDQEMEAIRKIKMDMINDVQDMRENTKKERELAMSSISGEVNALKQQIEELEKQAKLREELFLKQITMLNETIQTQASQINKMTMYWQLLCDVDCGKRHVPKCPFK